VRGGAGHLARPTLALGISQAGRYLREHIERGFNRDEAGRRVFDGVLSHIAGAGRIFMNVEFGQPYRTSTQPEDHFFPEVAPPFSVQRGDDEGGRRPHPRRRRAGRSVQALGQIPTVMGNHNLAIL
jgi:alpha/beta hydrolase family protein